MSVTLVDKQNLLEFGIAVVKFWRRFATFEVLSRCGTLVWRVLERSRSTIEQKSLTNKKTEDIYQRISTKFDKISAGLDEQSRLLKQIEVQMEENNKRRGAIDLTPWVVSIPVSFLLVALYNYVQS